MPSIDPGDYTNDELDPRVEIPSSTPVAEPGVCPGCKIAFNPDRVADRQAKGFLQCIDCMVADGREHELDEQDAEDYWSRNRTSAAAERRLTRGEE